MAKAVLVALACACGGSGHARAPGGTPPVAAAAFPATRWIPAHPTYAVAAHSIRDMQQATRDFFASFGILIESDVSQLSKFLQTVIVVDPLMPDALSAIGVDPDGGIAVFSESINPTLVVHLTSPDQLAGFFQQQRDRGMASQSSIIGTTEIFSTKLLGGAKVSWAVDHDWLWVHFTLPFDRDDPDAEWFSASHDPGAPTWTADWKMAIASAGGDGAGDGDASARLAGFVDLKAILGKLPKVSEALACARLLEPVGHFGFRVEGDDRGAAVRVTVETHAPGIAKALLPPPDGWDAAARQAPLAAQWNLDLAAVSKWAAPCVKLAGIDPSRYDSYGVRAARVMLTSFDPDDKSGTGAVAVDLSSTRYIRSLLDEIPLRSTLESARAFGPYQGKSLSVPFGPTIEYVLTDTLAIAAVSGDDGGLLPRVVGRGPGARTAVVFGADLVPAGLTADAWQYLFAAAQLPGGKRAIERLQRWRDLHLTMTLDNTRLTLEARGARK